MIFDEIYQLGDFKNEMKWSDGFEMVQDGLFY